MRVILIDTENTGVQSVFDTFDLSNTRLEFFISESVNHKPIFQFKFDIDQLKLLLETNVQIESHIGYPYSDSGKRILNAMDFFLTARLGELYASNSDQEIIVFSNDKGFEPVVNYYSQKGLNVRIIKKEVESLEIQSEVVNEVINEVEEDNSTSVNLQPAQSRLGLFQDGRQVTRFNNALAKRNLTSKVIKQIIKLLKQVEVKSNDPVTLEHVRLALHKVPLKDSRKHKIAEVFMKIRDEDLINTTSNATVAKDTSNKLNEPHIHEYRGLYIVEFNNKSMKFKVSFRQLEDAIVYRNACLKAKKQIPAPPKKDRLKK